MTGNSFTVIRATHNIRCNRIIVKPHRMRSGRVISPLGPIVHGTATSSSVGLTRGGVHRGRTFGVYLHGVGGRNLPVHLVSMRFAFSIGGVVFCFATSKHVSFHRLIGSLTTIFHAHVRLHRVNIHSRTGVLNNVNDYNHPLYYTAFLNSFRPISVHVTGSRDLSLGPAGVSNVYNHLVYYLGCRGRVCYGRNYGNYNHHRHVRVPGVNDGMIAAVNRNGMINVGHGRHATTMRLSPSGAVRIR